MCSPPLLGRMCNGLHMLASRRWCMSCLISAQPCCQYKGRVTCSRSVKVWHFVIHRFIAILTCCFCQGLSDVVPGLLSGKCLFGTAPGRSGAPSIHIGPHCLVRHHRSQNHGLLGTYCCEVVSYLWSEPNRYWAFSHNFCAFIAKFPLFSLELMWHEYSHSSSSRQCLHGFSSMSSYFQSVSAIEGNFIWTECRAFKTTLSNPGFSWAYLGFSHLMRLVIGSAPMRGVIFAFC